MEGPERTDETEPPATAVDLGTGTATDSGTGTATDSGTGTGADPAADTGSGAGRRPRGRTTLMIAGAALLGIVAGVCTGYVIQAGRAPTALPSLSQPVVEQAEGEVEPLSAAQDRRVRTDGDLRKLLITRPAGAKDSRVPMGRDGWADLSAYAGDYKDPAATFNDLVDDEFRRAATTSWRVGETYSVRINLVQFRQESKRAALEWAENGRYWAGKEPGTRDWPIPGTGDGNGVAYVHDTPERKPGYLPLYAAEAYAWRGDVCMEIRVYDSKPIPKAKIMDLAERQVGKL
ncbi:hypothetical protein GCM10010269_54190 [Streptomyces humidus]|uniref:Uncharacterized protein n=2 Tax=Streptomyces humidus TaxID=52259 RepID=A0A918G041_9ACTN|nr:hypothetical protein GCM10010269_54190 [Streptomyces humidus]